MVKCVLKRRDGFTKTIEREEAEPYIVMFKALSVSLYDHTPDDKATMVDENKVYFRFDRQFKNEQEEHVAVYYE